MTKVAIKGTGKAAGKVASKFAGKSAAMTTRQVETADAKLDGSANISEAARRSGVSAKMIRHYEDLGLMPKVARTAAGYRIYRDAEVHVLRFIRRARDLGFSMKEIETLLGLWKNRRRASADVKKLALKHIADLDARIGEMQAMRAALMTLANCCHGDARPDCPILEDLAAS